MRRGAREREKAGGFSRAERRKGAERPGARPGRPLFALELVALVAILLVGLLLRCSYLGELAKAPDLAYPPVDAGFHLFWAHGLATGDWTLPAGAEGRDPELRSHVFLRPPGYPYLLALLLRLSGGRPLVVRGLQMAIGLASCLLAFLLGRALLGRAVALVWTGLMSTYWIFILYEGELVEASLLVLLLLALVHTLRLLALRLTAARGAAAGAFLALAALVRPNVLLLAPAALAWGVWVAHRQGRPRRLLLPAAAAVAAGLLVIAPATIHNWLVEGSFVPISANGGVNLYVGNNDRANGTFVGSTPEMGSFGSCWDFPAVAARVARRLGHPVTWAGVDRFFAARAWAFVREHPGSTARLLARKAYLFCSPLELPHNRAVAFDRLFSPTLRHLPVTFPLALSLALVGAALLALELRRPSRDRDRPPGQLETLVAIALLLLTYFVSFLPFFVTALYRVPVIPWLLLAAAVTLARLGGLLWNRRFATAALPAAAVLALWLVARTPFVRLDLGASTWHYDRAVAWVYGGESARAEAELRQAIAANPDDPRPHNGLGKVLLDRGEVQGATSELEEAARLGPGSAVAWHNLGIARSRRGDLAGAAQAFRSVLAIEPEQTAALTDLGVVLERLGRVDEAVSCYDRALAAHPDEPRAANNLAWILATSAEPGRRDGGRAVELALAADRLTGGADPSVLDTLAAAYAADGRLAEAVAVAERAEALARPRSPDLAAAIAGRLERYRAGAPRTDR